MTTTAREETQARLKRLQSIRRGRLDPNSGKPLLAYKDTIPIIDAQIAGCEAHLKRLDEMGAPEYDL